MRRLNDYWVSVLLPMNILHVTPEDIGPLEGLKAMRADKLRRRAKHLWGVRSRRVLLVREQSHCKFWTSNTEQNVRGHIRLCERRGHTRKHLGGFPGRRYPAPLRGELGRRRLGKACWLESMLRTEVLVRRLCVPACWGPTTISERILYIVLECLCCRWYSPVFQLDDERCGHRSLALAHVTGSSVQGARQVRLRLGRRIALATQRSFRDTDHICVESDQEGLERRM